MAQRKPSHCVWPSLQRIDGNDTKTLSLHHLRTQMALVGQEPRLFAGTIRDNVTFGLKDVGFHEQQKTDARNPIERVVGASRKDRQSAGIGKCLSLLGESARRNQH